MNNTFQTESIQLAAFLLAKGIKFKEARKETSSRCTFIFEETQERIELTEKFNCYEALIEPHNYFNSLKDLKGVIYAK